MTTDLLLKPEDTGELPAAQTDPGMTTQNLAPYTHGLAPALRRPSAVLALVEDRTAREAEAPVEYVGRHRRVEDEDVQVEASPGRWGWLTVPLAMGWQRVRRSM